MTDRFELEEQIMDCWRVTDDLDVIAEKSMEREITPDELANLMIGLKQLYSMKFERMFNTFEQLISENKL